MQLLIDGYNLDVSSIRFCNCMFLFLTYYAFKCFSIHNHSICLNFFFLWFEAFKMLYASEQISGRAHVKATKFKVARSGSLHSLPGHTHYVRTRVYFCDLISYENNLLLQKRRYILERIERGIVERSHLFALRIRSNLQTKLI